MFAAINNNIRNINTTLAISVMSSGNLLAKAHGLAADMKEAMMEHQKNMATLMKVKAFEEYKKMAEKMKKSIDQQNEAVDQQTSTTAISAGYSRNGDKFKKVSNDPLYAGIVNAYHYFDRDKVDQYLAMAGFGEEMSGEALVDFLKNKSDVEVESYFYARKLALAAVQEKIFGSGNKVERANNPNKENIGEIGKWIGKAPNSKKSGIAQELAGNDAKKVKSHDANADDLYRK